MVGRALVGDLTTSGTQGYFPVWSSGQAREIANLHVTVAYRCTCASTSADQTV